MNYTRLTITLCILFSSLFFMKRALAQECERDVIDGTAYLDANNIATLYHANGAMYWDFADPAFEVPKGSGLHTVFAGGLWMGALDGNDALHAAAETYRQAQSIDFFSGPLNADGTTDTQLSEDFNEVWSVEKNAIDAFLLDVADGTLNNPIPDDILKWPGKDNPFLPQTAGRDLAPFVDTNSDGRYNPHDFDYPDIKGTKMLWWVFNDVLEPHTETNAEPLGFEIQASAYAYNCVELVHLNHSIFLELDIINKSQNDYHNLRIGKWLDPDLGNYNDDYVGSAPDLNAFYTYNGDDNDEGGGGYGNNIPVIATTFLNQDLSSYMYYENTLDQTTGNPFDSLHFYQYCMATWGDGTPVTYGGNGYGGTTPTNFMYPGDPNIPGEWSMIDIGFPLGDKRHVGAVGPFDLNPGETLQVDMLMSVHFSPSGNNLESVTTMLTEIPLIQARYDNDFANLPCLPTPGCTGPDCIWPGEVDNSSKANVKDMLEIGVGFSSTGDNRDNPSSYWLPQPSRDWTGTFLTGLNYKHADTDGNGIIDACDIVSINLNYNYEPLVLRNPTSGGIPVDIIFGQTEVGPGEVLDVYIYYGEESNPVHGAYGAAFFVEYNSDLVKQEETTVDMETTTWLDDDGAELISMYQDLPAQNRIDVAVSRTNQTGIDGWGQIGHLRFTMRDDIAGEFVSALDFNVNVVDGRAINFNEIEEQLDLGGGSVPVVTGIEDLLEARITMYPNPVKDVLFIHSAEKDILNIKVLEVSGKTILEITPDNQRSVEITTTNLAVGIYFVELLVEGEWIRNRVLVD